MGNNPKMIHLVDTRRGAAGIRTIRLEIEVHLPELESFGLRRCHSLDDDGWHRRVGQVGMARSIELRGRRSWWGLRLIEKLKRGCERVSQRYGGSGATSQVGINYEVHRDICASWGQGSTGQLNLNCPTHGPVGRGSVKVYEGGVVESSMVPFSL